MFRNYIKKLSFYIVHKKRQLKLLTFTKKGCIFQDVRYFIH